MSKGRSGPSSAATDAAMRQQETSTTIIMDLSNIFFLFSVDVKSVQNETGGIFGYDAVFMPNLPTTLCKRKSLLQSLLLLGGRLLTPRLFMVGLFCLQFRPEVCGALLLGFPPRLLGVLPPLNPGVEFGGLPTAVSLGHLMLQAEFLFAVLARRDDPFHQGAFAIDLTTQRRTHF